MEQENISLLNVNEMVAMLSKAYISLIEKEIPLEIQNRDVGDENGNRNLGLSGSKNSLKAFWKSQVDIAKSMSSYNSLKDDGLNNPLEEAIKRKIEMLKNSEVDWRKVLNDFI